MSGAEVPTWKKDYFRGALFAVRDADQSYHIEEVGGGAAALGPALVSTRCYAQSPFDGNRAIYFGGHGPNGIRSTDMAWIYRKRVVAPVAPDTDKRE